MTTPKQALPPADSARHVAFIQSALEQVEEYLSGRSDVIDGDYGEPAPNEEMVLLTEVRHAMNTLRALRQGGEAVAGYIDDGGNVITPMPTSHCGTGRVMNIGGFMRCTVCNGSFGPAPCGCYPPCDGPCYALPPPPGAQP